MIIFLFVCFNKNLLLRSSNIQIWRNKAKPILIQLLTSVSHYLTSNMTIVSVHDVVNEEFYDFSLEYVHKYEREKNVLRFFQGEPIDQ